MLGGDGDEDDTLARGDAAIAMNHRCAQKRPARLRLARRAGDFVFGHAGIMFELERGEPSALAAAVADKAHHRADVGSPARKRFRLRSGVEIALLNADRRHRVQPPVIGGKNATSFAPAIRASLRA